MDFEVIVSSLLPLATGQSARGEWKKQDVIFDLPGEFSRKLCVGFWNDRASEAAALRPGDRVALSVNVESREYNGRWYTEVRAWRMSRVDGAGAGAPTPGGAAAGGYPPFGGAPAAGGGYGAAAPAANNTGGYSANQGAATSQPAAAEVDDLPF